MTMRPDLARAESRTANPDREGVGRPRALQANRNQTRLARTGRGRYPVNTYAQRGAALTKRTRTVAYRRHCGVVWAPFAQDIAQGPQPNPTAAPIGSDKRAQKAKEQPQVARHIRA